MLGDSPTICLEGDSAGESARLRFVSDANVPGRGSKLLAELESLDDLIGSARFDPQPR